MVVGVVVRISGDLLALGGDATIIITEGVPVGVAVKIHLRLLVANGDCVKVINTNRLKAHDIVAECLLKFRGHEVVTRTGLGENGKMDLEPEKVQEERNDN